MAKRGRPAGYSPGKNRNLTHTIGEWSWNSTTLHKRVIAGADTDCWSWRGSKNQYGNIFGAYKNGKPQMTQANRLLWMEQTGLDAKDRAIMLNCGNRHCCNPQHFQAVDSIRSHKPTTIFYRLTISEFEFADLTDQQRTTLRQIVKELATSAGADWDLEYRWMRMSQDNYFLAQMKYPEVMKFLHSERQ